MSDFVPLAIAPYWNTINEDLLKIVDAVPDDKMNWTPKPELWNFRGILLHIASARDNWLTRDVKDGFDAPSVYESARAKPEIQREYRRSWERVERFLRNKQLLDATYGDVNGHWIAFHLLEHDIHHRADLLHYLALLGEPMPEVGPL